MATPDTQPSQLKNVKTSDGLGCLIIIALVLGGLNFRDRLDKIEKRQQEILNLLSSQKIDHTKPGEPDGSTKGE